MVKTALVLITLGMVSAISITFMAQYAYPIIEKNREEVLRQSILTILPNAQRFVTVDEQNKIFWGLTGNEKVAGYAFVGKGGGYQGVIRLMIGVSANWQSLKGVIVLENIETPGLGAKITSDLFLSQFQNLQIEPPIEYVMNKPPENPNQIQAITGATISSRAVINIINSTIAEVKTKLREDEP